MASSGHGHAYGGGGSSNNAGAAAWDGDSLNYLDVLREVYSSLVRVASAV